MSSDFNVFTGKAMVTYDDEWQLKGKEIRNREIDLFNNLLEFYNDHEEEKYLDEIKQAEYFLNQPFSSESPHLKMSRLLKSKFHKFMVKKRNTPFN